MFEEAIFSSCFGAKSQNESVVKILIIYLCEVNAIRQAGFTFLAFSNGQALLFY